MVNVTIRGMVIVIVRVMVRDTFMVSVTIRGIVRVAVNEVAMVTIRKL